MELHCWSYSVEIPTLGYIPKIYKDDLFVGDTNNGYLYHFDLNENRTSLKLDGVLNDKIAGKPEELRENFWLQFRPNYRH